MLRGEMLGAEEAYQMGLIHRIAPRGKAIFQALELAEKLAKQQVSSLLFNNL